jgi:hypothetical protein
MTASWQCWRWSFWTRIMTGLALCGACLALPNTHHILLLILLRLAGPCLLHCCASADRRLRWRLRSLLATTACLPCSVRTCLRCWGRRGGPTTGAVHFVEPCYYGVATGLLLSVRPLSEMLGGVQRAAACPVVGLLWSTCIRCGRCCPRCWGRRGAPARGAQHAATLSCVMQCCTPGELLHLKPGSLLSRCIMCEACLSCWRRREGLTTGPAAHGCALPAHSCAPGG